MCLTTVCLFSAVTMLAGFATTAVGQSTFEITRELDPKIDRVKKADTRTKRISFIGRSGKVRRQNIVVDAKPQITNAHLQPGATANPERIAGAISGDPKGANWWGTSGTAVQRRGSSELTVPAIQVRFTREGQREFEKLTEGWQGRRLAVLIDGEIVATPRVRDITNTSVLSITGLFDREESVAYAAALSGPSAIGETPKRKVHRLYPVANSGQAPR